MPLSFHPLLSTIDPPQQQFRRLLPMLLVLFIPTMLVLFSMFLYWLITGEDVGVLTRDPIAVVESELLEFQRAPDKSIHTLALLQLQFYTGCVSAMGVLLWCASATLAFFGWWQTRKLSGTFYPASFLLSLGLFTFMLLMDDQFLIHERALPRYLHLDEKWLFVVYGIAFAALCTTFFREILRSDYLLFGLALCLFGVSLAVDAVPEFLPQTHFFEDGAKFAGIVGWFGYLWRVATQQLSQYLPS